MMNSLEHSFCSSSVWRYLSERRVLPWVLAGQRLGDHTLEIGAGYGASTRFLRQRAARVTALEYNHEEILKWKARCEGAGLVAVCGDGTQLPFAAETFSSVTAILVMHHLRSVELQDRMLAEVARVLRPGGSFVGFEILDGWMNRVIHLGSTFTPFVPATARERMKAGGFGSVMVDLRRGAFRFSAWKARRWSEEIRVSGNRRSA
jgi:ubiquinone/menaquinone biosynthesis C-methylase UbiE